ncbi:MAG: glycosyltransferase [Microcystis aeruginosa Ma_MB_F_20061100_S19]|uniref:Undecaprenyl-phosphate 4-deoxy-4-formamido-L-arabinose transferase n=1 Tax=Microcystis aeruginosa SPC777 TaxID=482300 RepID=S3J877_MICAE|nr:glycosyltransferase [Microcystis aeruginosa]NCR98245.1 glycosyltransferase [Microcystis aeruginosa L311-01]OCY14794.1 MAG: glycosyl transferase [Microcystis aeruginosa CACIAM 03]TRU15493.1 MAG: glycosyltransferase [Microcystis aeruginosa Ma_MB_F_20061100_S19]TRU16885.1 MAG: glycosyltransferase [Microcystis aeruginosa Ma_MB_F_20061100_S19D]EPF21385.1 Undecaprenyl-phosphate 4-deoxy-4-formamido-L-arabinose transferase [Microcystis aeruginosa SPC777]
MLTKIYNNKIFRFLIAGGVAFLINLFLISWFIDDLGFNTPILANVANVISIEISLIASFFIYRIWVWTGGDWTIRDVILIQLPLYHLSAGLAVLLRVFLVFPFLNWLGVSPGVNTMIGVLLGASINYVASDSLIFKPKNKTNETEMYYPEGLAPAFEMDGYSHPRQSRDNYAVKTLSIVIPAYNEEDCIESTAHLISERLERDKIDYEILVVNDNSKDNTEAVLQKINQENPRIRYINNYYPNGFGFAVRCGLENFSGDAVAVVMADNSDSPDNIVDYYYQLQEGYDCVFGSRFIKGGKVIDYPLHKLFVNRLANLFIQVLFGLKFNDTTNAFKIYRKEVIEGISPLLSHHFNLTVEMPLKAIVRGYSYTTIPITWRNRTTGVSKLKLKEMGSRYLFIVLSIWLEKHFSRGDYKRKPVQKIRQK